MDPTSEDTAGVRDAQRREHKDQIVLRVTELCRRLRIRALFGGGSILTAQGIISPVVAPSISIVVDPASSHDLLTALRDGGWRDARPRRSLNPLPSVRRRLVHHEWIAGIAQFSLIPGFFADPEETFDVLWERRREIPLRGELIPGLDRLASAVLASHNSLDGRGPHASTHSAYFADQFRQVLDESERAALGELVARVGGGAEMSSFLDALGIAPIPFTLPSEAYVRWRLGVDEAPDHLRRIVATLELPVSGRRQLRSSALGRPASFRAAVAVAAGLPTTARAVFGSKGRWKAADR